MHQCWPSSHTELSQYSQPRMDGFRVSIASWRSSSGRPQLVILLHSCQQQKYKQVYFLNVCVWFKSTSSLICNKLPFALMLPFCLKERVSNRDKDQSASYLVLRSQHQPTALRGPYDHTQCHTQYRATAFEIETHQLIAFGEQVTRLQRFIMTIKMEMSCGNLKKCNAVSFLMFLSVLLPYNL